MALRISLTAITAFIALLMPLSAQTYATPEQVLFEESFFLPPSGREAKGRIAVQREESAKRRQEEQEAYFASQREYEDEEQTIEEVLMNLTKAIENLENTGDTPESRRTQRLVDRVDRQTESFSGQVIRSGAPLAPTGAGAIVASVSILGALVWTLKRAGKKSCRS